MENIYLEEIDNIDNVKKIYEKLIRFSQGTDTDIDFDEKEKICLKRIIINNQLMTILNILEVIKDETNPSMPLKINEIFFKFFKTMNIENISNDNSSDYLNLFRNAIAHHNDIIISFSEEECNNIKIKKNSRSFDDDSCLDLDIKIDELNDLAESLILIFNNNITLKNQFNREMDLNSAINEILNGNKDVTIRPSSIDLSYSFYVSQLFEMIKYAKPASLKKRIKIKLLTKSEVKNLIYGISNDTDQLSIEEIEKVIDVNQKIEQNILFFYNAYPDELRKIFDNSFSFNDKSIDELLKEFSNQLVKQDSNEQTDFQRMIKNTNNDYKIEVLKQELIKLFLTKLPKSNRLIKLTDDYKKDDKTDDVDKKQLLSLFSVIHNLKLDSNIDDLIQYFSLEDLKTTNGELNFFTLFNKIRNSIMHNVIDVKETSDKKTFYAFQDVNANNGETNYVLIRISSEYLLNVLDVGTKFLKLYGEAFKETLKEEKLEFGGNDNGNRSVDDKDR